MTRPRFTLRDVVAARLNQASNLRRQLFCARFAIAFTSRTTGLRIKRGQTEFTIDEPRLQTAVREGFLYCLKMGSLSKRHIFKEAADFFNETNFERFYRAAPRLGKTAKRQFKFIDVADVIVLAAWDGFDIKHWPVVIRWPNGFDPTAAVREFPPLSRWTAHAARYCINWLATGRGDVLKSHTAQKAYEKRVRNMNLFSERPFLVRDAEYDKRLRVLRPIFSTEGERWGAENSRFSVRNK
jgi:hypothetical protein